MKIHITSGDNFGWVDSNNTEIKKESQIMVNKTDEQLIQEHALEEQVQDDPTTIANEEQARNEILEEEKVELILNSARSSIENQTQQPIENFREIITRIFGI